MLARWSDCINSNVPGSLEFMFSRIFVFAMRSDRRRTVGEEKGEFPFGSLYRFAELVEAVSDVAGSEMKAAGIQQSAWE